MKFFNLLLIITVLISCKKISVPNEEAKQIFGTWDYKTSFGGYSGGGGSTKYNTNQWIEFSEKGVATVYENDKKVSKTKFTIKMKNSITGHELPALVYRNGNFETYIINSDTLIISEEFYDGYGYLFTRK